MLRVPSLKPGPLLSFLIAAALAAPAVDAATRDIRALGGSNAFCRPPLGGTETVRGLFRDQRSDLETVLRLSGWPGDPADVFAAVQAGRVTDTLVPVGTRFEWMAVRRRGRADVARDLRWAGDGPFPAFAIDVPSRGVMYRFVVPKPCGNLALLESRPLPSCGLAVAPASVCVTEPVDIRVTGTDAASLAVMVTPPRGPELDLGTSGRFTQTFGEPGVWRVTAYATSPDGGRSAVCSASVEVRPCQPVCTLLVTSDEVYAGEPIGVDLSASRSPVGAIQGARVIVFDSAGFDVAQVPLDPPYQDWIVLRKPGVYRLRGEVEDAAGRSSSGCEARVTVVRRGGFIVDAMGGMERRWRDGFPRDRNAGLLGAKLGWEHEVQPRLRIAGLAGGVLNLRDTDHSSLFADAEVNYMFRTWFLGGGLGLWDITRDESRGAVALVHAGWYLPWEIGRENPALFGEGRVFLDHLDNIENNYVVWGGLRFWP